MPDALSPADLAAIAAAKKALRAEAAARRAAAYAVGRARMDEACARLVEAALPAPRVFSAYRPIGEEIDPGVAWRTLVAGGARGCLPVVEGKGRPLAFRAWAEGEPLERASFGVEIPVSREALVPDLLIVPLLAFDRRGFRLGYGGGFYDRTLAKLRAAGPVRAIGFAFAAQEVPEVPIEATDMPLDLIVTEAEVIRPTGPAA